MERVRLWSNTDMERMRLWSNTDMEDMEKQQAG
jgi:hypothetical protein